MSLVFFDYPKCKSKIAVRQQIKCTKTKYFYCTFRGKHLPTKYSKHHLTYCLSVYFYYINYYSVLFSFYISPRQFLPK
ncbi:hypothetical protein AGR13a_Lc30044 [Agrobacterium genomosp. 13 str. CFBP 6927]|uniref:Uncharacterized protein n=1 Tax=Agrobacterium genomosp. 13 str. CFBP 6927 TaxID=1183428 RepID=A0ABP2BMP2_9HYPH|nr:hypothetical protein AGR13a_Lc30044 [Agrobacterium genomosp. 13 str. CFBP 6927]